MYSNTDKEKTPSVRLKNALKIFCGVVFVLVTELSLGLYMYRYVNNNFVSKFELDELLLKSVKNDGSSKDTQNPTLLEMARDNILQRQKRQVSVK